VENDSCSLRAFRAKLAISYSPAHVWLTSRGSAQNELTNSWITSGGDCFRTLRPRTSRPSSHAIRSHGRRACGTALDKLAACSNRGGAQFLDVETLVHREQMTGIQRQAIK
jgi:hypothetical protein